MGGPRPHDRKRHPTTRTPNGDSARDRDERLRALFDDAPLGFAVVDRGGRFLETNTRLAELLGRDQDTLAQLTFRDVTHPEDLATSDGWFATIRDGTRTGYTYEKRYLRADGRTVRARTTIRGVTAEASAATGAFAVAMVEDITDRWQAEREVRQLHRELRGREERYRTLVTNVPGAIYRRDIEAPYRVRFVSDTLLDIAGISATELVAERRSMLTLVHPDDHDVLHELAGRELGIGESYLVEYRVQQPGGGLRWVQDKGRAIARRAGAEAELFDGILTDITPRRDAEEELKRAARFRDELMAGLSHDMQTPLSAIVGTARMLQDTPAADESERVPLYDLLGRQSARLYALVQQFLDHARLEVDRPLVVRPREIDLVESVAAAGRLFEHERTVVLDLPDAPVVVRADPDRLQQILGNLVSNAIKYSADPVTVRVIDADEDTARVEVVDAGVGMGSDDLRRLFGKFHRGESAEGTHGTGLGLYVSRAVAEAMGGSIDVRSQLGEGSSFALALPRGAPRRPAPAGYRPS